MNAPVSSGEYLILHEIFFFQKWFKVKKNSGLYYIVLCLSLSVSFAFSCHSNTVLNVNLRNL